MSCLGAEIALCSWAVVTHLLCGFLLVLMAALPAQTIQREELASGLTLVVAEHHSSSTVAVQVFVRAGPAHEGRWLNHGISTVLGRVLMSAAPAAVREQLDGAGREFSVTTTPTYTCFAVVTTQHQTPQVVRALARLCQWQGYTTEDLDRVREQLRQLGIQEAADPAVIATHALDRLLHHDHPARWPVAGDPQLRSRLTVADLRTYQQSHYTAPNMVVAVAGNVYSEAVGGLVRQAFVDTPWSAYQRRQPTSTEPSGGNRSVFRRVPGLGERRSVIAWSTVPLGHHDQYPLRLLAAYLDGPLSPLRAALESNQLADRISVVHEAAVGRPGSLRIAYRVRGEQGSAALAAINQVLRDLKEGGIDPADLQAAQRHLRLQMATGILDMATLADGVGRWELAIGRPQGFIAHTQDRTETVAGLGEIARRYLVVDRFHRVSLSDSGIEPPPSVERLGPEPLDTVLPEVESFDNGLRLVSRSLPIGLAAVRLTMGAGPAVEDSANAGASALLAELFRGGTDSVDFRVALQREGMDYQVELGIDSLAVGITCLPDQAPDAIRRLKQLVTSSIEDPARFAIAQQRLLGRIASTAAADSWQQRLESVVDQRLLADHFAGQPILGTRESVQRLTPAVLDAFLTRLRSGSNMLLSLYGEYDAGAAISAVHSQFTSGTSFTALPLPRRSGQGWSDGAFGNSLTIVDEQAATQALAMVFRGVAADAALQRRAAGDVLHEILSGRHGTIPWLYQRLAQDEPVPLQVTTADGRYPGRGFFTLGVQIPPGTADIGQWRARLGGAMRDLQHMLAGSGEDGSSPNPAMAAAQAACLLAREQMGQNQQAIAAYHAHLLLREGGLQAVRDYDAAVRAVSAADLLALLEIGFDRPLLDVALLRNQSETAPGMPVDEPAAGERPPADGADEDADPPRAGAEAEDGAADGAAADTTATEGIGKDTDASAPGG
jgi:predicted Zn-dependent peptidase